SWMHWQWHIAFERLCRHADDAMERQFGLKGILFCGQDDQDYEDPACDGWHSSTDTRPRGDRCPAWAWVRCVSPFARPSTPRLYAIASAHPRGRAQDRKGGPPVPTNCATRLCAASAAEKECIERYQGCWKTLC